MKPFTYSLLLFFTIIICFVASFNKRILFSQYFGSFIKAAAVTGILFVASNIWFVCKGVWWFDTNHTVGIEIAGLPVEEWLFFLCTTFSSVFTYFCFDKFFKADWIKGFNNLIAFITIIICSLIALLHYDKIYTLVTALATISTIIFLHFIVRADWIAKASLVFTILMLGFMPVNRLLTGTGLEWPIVNYNPNAFLGIRILTIPIEDAVYGYVQFIIVLYFFKRFNGIQNKSHENQ